MTDRTEVYEDAAGEYRWRRLAANNRVIADSAEGYTRKHDAERAARRVFEGPIDEPAEPEVTESDTTVTVTTNPPTTPLVEEPAPTPAQPPRPALPR
jgi:uncharacterized protein YegP (UPF0339 family)